MSRYPDLPRTMMWTLFGSAIVWGLTTVATLIALVVEFRASVMVGLVLAAVACIASIIGALVLSDETKEVDSRHDVEQKLLNKDQRKTLNTARGSLLFEKGMEEVQEQRDAMVRKQIERAHREDT